MIKKEGAKALPFLYVPEEVFSVFVISSIYNDDANGVDENTSLKN